MPLNTEPRVGDDFYEALIDAHRGLAPAQSHALNARLVLLLANHIGEAGVLREALQAAREGAEGADGAPPAAAAASSSSSS